jgi:hypothetical protein
LKLQYDEQLSKFAFNFNLRRYNLLSAAERSGRHSEADAVWAMMLASRVPPHTVMCGAYVHCLGCQAGAYTRPFQLSLSHF